MKIAFYVIALISLALNVWFIVFQPKPKPTPVNPSQNHLKPITIKGLMPDIITNSITNTITVEYTPEAAAGELNRYRTNTFLVTITNYRARVSLVDRWVEFDTPVRPEADNLVKAGIFISGTYQAGYWRRVVTIFSCPVFLGGEIAYRRDSGLDAGVSVIVGF